MASLPLNYPNLHLMSITSSVTGQGVTSRGPDDFKLSQNCLDLARENIPEPYDFSLGMYVRFSSSVVPWYTLSLKLFSIDVRNSLKILLEYIAAFVEEKVVNDAKKNKKLRELAAEDDAQAQSERQSKSTEGDEAVEVALLNLNVGGGDDSAVRNSSVISDDIVEASNQAMVTKLMAITSAGETQCIMFLEKTDYDLENAAAEYFASLSNR